ncbi:endolytic transglycosylase MltG [Ectobacillus sp. JY-23]|uniref:endolytic transglycosylase MltG n=1 Tax=Ectobacillus sp. JY-23 TaxID=2933872 RepID=UPI001FF415C8|nr:endolytic transglycosylase MltG [Ectobacillus sp. JY-23]UOY94503.1 endolytic transglycosylase MltG [Ectobacillus sp. JY-23]
MSWNEQAKKKKRRRIAAIIILLLFAVTIGGYGYIASALKPVADTAEKKEIEIPSGTSTAGIGELLEKNGIIKNGTVFQYYVKANFQNGLKAGNYLLSPSMSVKEIATIITSGSVYNPARYKITIPEGSQLKDIVKIIANEFKFNEDDVLRQLNDGNVLAELQKTYPQLITNKLQNPAITYKLEGYLYPATYSYYKKENTLQEIVEPMLEKTNQYVTANKPAIEKLGFDVHQFLTMSSLIEEEATAMTDRRKIASVFYNRLKANMPLQTDPTVLYALGKHKDRVLYSDLKIASPYNTYVVTGLPVGPIANAGEPSMKAALDPEQTDYYYFLAALNGEVFFAKTLEEHNALKEKHITSQR